MYDVFFAVLCGRATEDAVQRTMSGDTRMATFSIAKNDSNQNTTFVSVACFGTLAQFVLDNVKKGDRLTVIGDFKAVEKNGKTYLSLTAQSIFPGAYAPAPQKAAASPHEAVDLNDYS